MTTKVIVLAAGKGTRMKSSKPKVLHHLAEKSLLAHVLDAAATLRPQQISVVIGHGADSVKAEIPHDVSWVMQTEQLGTGHAVQQALGDINEDDRVVIAYGDVPLTQSSTFQSLLDASQSTNSVKPPIGLLTVLVDDPTGYGRIVRDSDDCVTGIVEHKDASTEQLAIREVNSGMLSINGGLLKRLLDKINNKNSQGEYYLTDIFALAVADGHQIQTVHPEHEWEVSGVNSRSQLAELERIHQFNNATQLMDGGVSLRDPTRIDIRGSLATGSDIEIDVNCVFIGENKIADHVSIGANCILINTELGTGTEIKPNSILENTVVAEGCTIGPFARLRPGTQLAKQAKIGNFVETKNASIGQGSKVNHLSYVGDSEIGQNVNVGAGTITCNYDGANKHRTVMEDDVFIGSNSALVAPVKIGKGATVGAGAVINRDVGEDMLVIARARAVELTDWERPVKKKK